MTPNHFPKPIYLDYHSTTADVSHEFRNPLMVIESNVAVFLKYYHGMIEIDRESFDAIASAMSQMTNLIFFFLQLRHWQHPNI
jgi:signal transduction histidine kinase